MNPKLSREILLKCKQRTLASMGTLRRLLQRDIVAAIGGIADMTRTSRKRR